MESRSLDDLHNRLRDAYTLENLTRITTRIIHSYREKRYSLLRRLADEIQTFTAFSTQSNQAVFSGLLLLYHPDRHRRYTHEIESLYHNGDLTGLGSLEHIFVALRLQSEGDTHLAADHNYDFHRNRQRNDRSDHRREWAYESDGEEGFPKDEEADGERDATYGYDEEDFDSVYSARDPQFAEEDLDEEEEFREEYDAVLNPDPVHDVLTALKLREYGNLDVDLHLHHLELIEGELDLSSYEINDLSGIENCIHVTSLNLSDNEIEDLLPLGLMVQLKELYLAANRIENLSALSTLFSLEVLDLAENEIRDIGCLLGLQALKVLVVTGNRIPAEQLLEFRKQGVIVVD